MEKDSDLKGDVEIKAARVILPCGETVDGQFILNEAEESQAVHLELCFNERRLAVTAPDYFEALCEIRRMLEPDQTWVVCYGSSRNVYPSGMSRDMGLGTSAYKLTWGEPARMSDLVNIFDCPEAGYIPTTLKEQSEFYACWLASF
jgi:hypothetical protein